MIAVHAVLQLARDTSLSVADPLPEFEHSKMVWNYSIAMDYMQAYGIYRLMLWQVTTK